MSALGVDTTSENTSAAMLYEYVPNLIDVILRMLYSLSATRLLPLQAYMRVVSRTLNEWIQKIMVSDWKSEASQDTNGHWVSSATKNRHVLI